MPLWGCFTSKPHHLYIDVEISLFGHCVCENSDCLYMAILHMWSDTDYLCSHSCVHRYTLPVWSLERAWVQISSKESRRFVLIFGGLPYNRRECSLWSGQWVLQIKMTSTSRDCQRMSVTALVCLSTCQCLPILWELLRLTWVCGSKLSTVGNVSFWLRVFHFLLEVFFMDSEGSSIILAMASQTETCREESSPLEFPWSWLGSNLLKMVC